MNPIAIGGLLCLLATAIFLGACQSSSAPAANQSFSLQQKPDGDPVAAHKRRCCHRASRTGNK